MKTRSKHSISCSHLIFAAIGLLPLAAIAGDLPVGTAKGTFTPDEEPAVKLTIAATFVDVKDDRKPTLLILSDKKLPTEKWTSEFDLMREHPKFNGVIFWLDNEGKVFRSDVYENGRQSSVSGFFDLKLDGKMGKDISGAVTSSGGLKSVPKVEATFHAMAK